MAIVLLTIGLVALCAVAIVSAYAQNRQRVRLHESLGLMADAHDAFKIKFDSVFKTLEEEQLERGKALTAGSGRTPRVSNYKDILDVLKRREYSLVFVCSASPHLSSHTTNQLRLARRARSSAVWANYASWRTLSSAHRQPPPNIEAWFNDIEPLDWFKYAPGRTFSTAHRQPSQVTVKAWIIDVEPPDWTAEYEVLNTGIADRRRWAEEITSRTG